MTAYQGECQALGFICAWQVVADTQADAATAMLEHINEAHGTGATSPALSALIARHVTKTAAQAWSGHYDQEHAS
jgi:predicted small metal-binding protein